MGNYFVFNGSLGLISTMEDGVVFLSRLYRKLRIYLDVIIVSAIMGFFAYRFTANSLINAVDRYFNNKIMEEELASYITQDIKSGSVNLV